MSNNMTDPTWERNTIHKLLFSTVTEQRRTRRWNMFFKLIFFAYIIALPVFMYLDDGVNAATKVTTEHTAIIDIKGVISSDTDANADAITKALGKAFANTNAKAVVLRINSPGGSPVQAHQIFDRIRALRTKHPEMQVYAVIDDMGTSAAYLIASASDAIYANRSSIVGSIGVVFPAFGFTGLLEKLGVERRLYTAGKYKAMFDPFSEANEESRKIMQSYLDNIHQHFINAVKLGRGSKLGKSKDIFSGLFWTGDKALQLGLIDGIGDIHYVAENLLGNMKLVDYEVGGNLIERVVKRVGASIKAMLLAF